MIRAGGVVVPGSPGLVLALGLARFAGSELDDRFGSGALIRAGAPGLTLRFKIRMCSDFAGPPTVPDRHRPCTNLVLLALKTARVFVVVDFPIVLFTLFSGEFYISSTLSISYHIAPHFPWHSPWLPPPLHPSVKGRDRFGGRLKLKGGSQGLPFSEKEKGLLCN